MKQCFITIGIILIILGSTLSGMAQENGGGMLIDAIPDTGQSTIVLSDTVFRVAADAVFYAKDKRTQIAFSQFKEGDRVGLTFDSKNVIMEMWLISE